MKGARTGPPRAYAWGGKRYVLVEECNKERNAKTLKKQIEKTGDKSRIKEVNGIFGVYRRCQTI